MSGHKREISLTISVQSGHLMETCSNRDIAVLRYNIGMMQIHWRVTRQLSNSDRQEGSILATTQKPRDESQNHSLP